MNYQLVQPRGSTWRVSSLSNNDLILVLTRDKEPKKVNLDNQGVSRQGLLLGGLVDIV
jgi:hypothetical protein